MLEDVKSGKDLNEGNFSPDGANSFSAKAKQFKLD